MNARIRKSKACRELRLASALSRAALGLCIGVFLWPALWLCYYFAYDMIGCGYDADIAELTDWITDDVFFSFGPFVLFLLICTGLAALAGEPLVRWMAGWNDRFGSHGPGPHD
jgi:hypothetical protein